MMENMGGNQGEKSFFSSKLDSRQTRLLKEMKFDRNFEEISKNLNLLVPSQSDFYFSKKVFNCNVSHEKK